MDSILDSVKSYIGILPEDTSFDTDLLMTINAVMFAVSQLGAGPSEPVIVEDSTQEWIDYFEEALVGPVRQYVSMRSQVMFDPPSSSQLMEALKNSIDEIEWRILAEVDKTYYETREVESE